MTDPTPGPTVVLGAGNLSMGDDGLGPAVLDRLEREWQLPEDVRLVHGDVWGMALLPVIEDAGRLIVVDAITAGGSPGSPVVLRREEFPTRYGVRLSPHQVGLTDVFALASLRETLPADAVAIGLEPAGCAWGDGLSEPVAAGIGSTAERIVAQLEAWGHRCPRR